MNEAVSDATKKILEDIVSLWVLGTEGDHARAVDQLLNQDHDKYQAMLETLQRQCDRYQPSVGNEYLAALGLTPKEPTTLRRYFIVLGYLKPISQGTETARSTAAKQIATLPPEEYSFAIQALLRATQYPHAGDTARALLQNYGLSFVPIQPIFRQQTETTYKKIHDPVAAERAKRGQEEAFRLLHYGSWTPLRW